MALGFGLYEPDRKKDNIKLDYALPVPRHYHKKGRIHRDTAFLLRAKTGCYFAAGVSAGAAGAVTSFFTAFLAFFVLL